MRTRIFKAYINQFCQECGEKSKNLIEVKPNIVNKKIRICIKCYKENFKKDLEIDLTD